MNTQSNYITTLFLTNVGSIQFQDQLFTYKKVNKRRILYTPKILVSKFDLYYARLKTFVWKERWIEIKRRGEMKGKEGSSRGQ
jgi:hypothetical protein